MRYRITKKLGKIRIDDDDLRAAIDGCAHWAANPDKGSYTVRSRRIIEEIRAFGSYDAMIAEMIETIKIHPNIDARLHRDAINEVLYRYCRLMLTFQMEILWIEGRASEPPIDD